MQADRLKEFPTQEDLKLGFQHGFQAIIGHWKIFFGHTRSSGDPSRAQVYKNYIFNENLLILMQFIRYKKLT